MALVRTTGSPGGDFCIVSAVEPRGRSWLEQRTEVMLEELALLGLSAPKVELAKMIQKALAEMATTLGISQTSARRYVDDEKLRSLAREAALRLTEERPGADLLDQPRTIPLPLELLGQVVMALAEATRIRVLNADAAGAEQNLELLSFLGQVLREGHPRATGQIHLPQAALARAARLLEASAEVIEGGGNVPPGLSAGVDRSLVKAFLEDATIIRTLIRSHGADAGPTPDS